MGPLPDRVQAARDGWQVMRRIAATVPKDPDHLLTASERYVLAATQDAWAVYRDLVLGTPLRAGTPRIEPDESVMEDDGQGEL